MHDGWLIAIGVLVGLGAGRIWLGYRLGELRHTRRHARRH